jgi:ABC-type Fe3+ transport system permease subunit
VALSLLLLGWALPSVVTAKLFEWLYHPSAGLVNVVLGGRPINWLGDPHLALPALVAADVWRTMPFVALLCYARLLTIPGEVYEAARVDGAARLATLTAITLPLLRPILLIALLFRTLDALRAFDLMFVLTGGGPANTTETLTVYAYRSLFQTLQLGFGAAIGVVTLVAIQKRVPRETVFQFAVMASGAALIAAATTSSIVPAALFVALVGAFAGSSYVTGFTVLQENVHDELRGRTFATLYTVVRLCLLISLTISPLWADFWDRVSDAVFTDGAIEVGGATYALPGVRFALWGGGLITFFAGFVSWRSVRRARRRQNNGVPTQLAPEAGD